MRAEEVVDLVGDRRHDVATVCVCGGEFVGQAEHRDGPEPIQLPKPHSNSTGHKNRPRRNDSYLPEVRLVRREGRGEEGRVGGREDARARAVDLLEGDARVL